MSGYSVRMGRRKLVERLREEEKAAQEILRRDLSTPREQRDEAFYLAQADHFKSIAHRINKDVSDHNARMGWGGSLYERSEYASPTERFKDLYAKKCKSTFDTIADGTYGSWTDQDTKRLCEVASAHDKELPAYWTEKERRRQVIQDTLRNGRQYDGAQVMSTNQMTY